MTGGAAGGLGEILGPVLGMIGQNVTNKQNQGAQQNALNQALSIFQGGLGSALHGAQGFGNQAFGNLQNYLSANPNPASLWGGIQGPQQYGGGGVMSPGGPGLFGGYGTGYRRGAPRMAPVPPGMGGPQSFGPAPGPGGRRMSPGGPGGLQGLLGGGSTITQFPINQGPRMSPGGPGGFGPQPPGVMAPRPPQQMHPMF